MWGQGPRITGSTEHEAPCIGCQSIAGHRHACIHTQSCSTGNLQVPVSLQVNCRSLACGRKQVETFATWGKSGTGQGWIWALQSGKQGTSTLYQAKWWSTIQPHSLTVPEKIRKRFIYSYQDQNDVPLQYTNILLPEVVLQYPSCIWDIRII